ncbi:MAG: 50S ribosomal protein L11 methyltransferase [Armatimonadota bacterium]
MIDKHWTIKFKGYLPVDDRLEDRLIRINEEIDTIPSAAYEIDEGNGIITIDCAKIEGWHDASMRRLRSIRVGKHIIITPPWDKCETSADDILIIIDPQTAFGSGLHQTTRLCLAEIETHVFPGSTVIDIGTGSGILAITAAKLGADKVFALETDPASLEAAKDNIDMNGVSDKVQVLHADNPAVICEPVDLVVANITAESIIPLIERIRSILKTGGLLIASGMTDKNVSDVEMHLTQAGFNNLHRSTDGNWVAVTSYKS